MNIFIELNKYRPRAAITPEENFFTQSFKIILEHSPAVAKEIVSYISNNKVLHHINSRHKKYMEIQ